MPPVSSRTMMRSRPSTTSRFRVEASASAAKTKAGRRLAKSSMSLRSRSKPRSGFCAKGRLSHFGPPTAPSRIASVSSAAFIAASVSGMPCLSMAAPPTRSSLTSKLAIRRLSKYSMTRAAWCVTSGPMPSPGNSRIFRFDAMNPLANGRPSEPGLRLLAPVLELGDRRLFLEGQADVVDAVEQALLAELIDFKMHDLAIGARDGLARQVDGEPRIRTLAGVVHQMRHGLSRQRDRQNAVLEAVAVEDVGEARRDHGANAEIEERPRRMLARRAAAEVLARHQDLRLAIGRLVENEFGLLGAVGIIAQLVEQRLAEAGPLDRLEVLLRDDLVGIDIDHRQWRCDAGQRGELLHGPSARKYAGRV